jgi:hypothetical protein
VTKLSSHNTGTGLTPAERTALAQWLKGSTTVTAPAAPASLSATATSPTQVNLTWVDNANDETGFRIERATNSSFTAAFASFTVGANVATYSDSTLTGSTTYYYRIFATNAAGDSAASNTASVTTPAGTGIGPAAPTSLSATTAGATQINLTWADNANNETGFRIERATNSGFTASLVTATVGSNTRTYSATGLTAGTTYYFRVYATNAAGSSAASNVTSATTSPAPTSTLVSFSATILPMMTQACNRSGCHPTAGVTISNYSNISSRASNLGMGSSYLTSAQKATLATWVSQGSPNN